MLPRTSRVYHDPLHGAISLNRSDPVESLLVDLIDTPAFQRLRRIRQLGPASLTFHGAEGSRFTHSLGVLAVARRAFDRLSSLYPDLAVHRATVLVAALLHDIGHGPFSHTSEEIFGGHHEFWTRRIVREDPAIRGCLEGFAPALSQAIEQVYEHTYPVPLIWQLVSSQLDCDRLDYLMRDSYFTGASYGHLDLDRILLAMDYDPFTQQLVVVQKGLSAIEHYLIVRYFMYAQVYNHPKNLAATLVLKEAFRRARELLTAGELTADETVTAWLTQPVQTLPLTTYLTADDGVFMYHLNQWQHHGDALLSDLARRYLNRVLPNALNVSDLSEPQQETLLAQVRTYLQGVGWDAARYTALRSTWNRGYTLYQRGINLQTSMGLREINDLSPLVNTLTRAYQQTWLLYPADVKDWIQTVRETLGGSGTGMANS